MSTLSQRSNGYGFRVIFVTIRVGFSQVTRNTVDPLKLPYPLLCLKSNEKIVRSTKMETSAPINPNPNPLQLDPGPVEEPQQSPEDNRVENEGNSEDEKRVPYTIPPWSEPPCHRYFLQLLKDDGSITQQFPV